MLGIAIAIAMMPLCFLYMEIHSSSDVAVVCSPVIDFEFS